MIRDARVVVLPELVRIYNDAVPGREATADTTPVTVESRRAWLTDRDARHPVWVYEQDGMVLGWLSLSKFYGRPAYGATVEVGIYVANSALGRGVAKTLLQTALERAPGLGLTTFLGFVFAHNRRSVALCERFGFERWGHLPRVAVLAGIARDLLLLGTRLDAPL